MKSVGTRNGLTRLLKRLPPLMLALLCGCGTVSTHVKGISGPYSGLGYDAEKLSSSEEWLDLSGQGSVGNVPFPWPRGLLWVIDVPLSFAVDTLMLPVDCFKPGSTEPGTEFTSSTLGGSK